MALIDKPDCTSVTMLTDLHRRDVLRRLGALGITGAIGQLYSGSLFARSGEAATGLDRLVDGEVVNRAHDRYEAWRNSMVWHLRKPERYPDAIIRAQSEQDVIAAVKYATDNGLKVSARSSGHNSTGAALRNGGLLIDLALLRGIEIDAARKTARIQPALWSEQLVQEAGKHGLAFPAAHCPTVALGGYLLGGGMGWNNAHWDGIACHAIRSADIVLAGGRKVTASADAYPDLFWAVRGAGYGFFGVVTAMELQLYPLPRAIHTSMYITPLDKLHTVFAALDELNDAKDERVEILVLLMHDPQASADTPPDQAKICMVGVNAFADTEDEARAMLAPFANNALAAASVFKLEYQPSSFEQLYNPEGLDTGIGRYMVDSIWTEEPGQSLLSVAEHFKTTPSARTHVLCAYGLKTELRADACFSRIANHYIASYLLWNDAADDAANEVWLRHTNALLQPYSKGTYINEIEATLFPERVKSSFSEESWQRLAALRKKYDPDGVFHSYGRL